MSERILSGLAPEGVFRFFEELCAIPHGSGNTKAISDYCMNFAHQRGLWALQDAHNNVIIRQAGTAGYEDHPTVILQGHLDMVCAKDPDCPLDMEKDGLRLGVADGYVFAHGTTLGGDDGIAVAYALAILDDSTIPHPPLEAVFTVDEEIGLLGASALDCSPLQGRTLLNIDSESEGILTVGCAGGARCDLVLPFEGGHGCGILGKLTLSGFTGGHSGTEIHKGRSNAIVLLGQILSRLTAECAIQLQSLQGGKQDNAIPTSASATFLLTPDVQEKARREIETWWTEVKAACAETDPHAACAYQDGAEVCGFALSSEDSAKAIQLLCAMPNGVQAMSPHIPGLVETSLNIGILSLQQSTLQVTASVRSSVNGALAALIGRLSDIGAQYGASFSTRGEYPAWEYKENSPLRDTMVRIFRQQYGKDPVVETIHAGLECGLFGNRIPDLDSVSFGPDILEIHTPRERLDIASVERTWQFLLAVLKAL